MDARVDDGVGRSSTPLSPAVCVGEGRGPGRTKRSTRLHVRLSQNFATSLRNEKLNQ